MKKSILFLSSLLIALVVMADPVTPESARRAAEKFLQGQGSQLKNEAMRAPRRAMGKQSVTEASPYYVFNADKGFVVISGDDCVGENLVLGYTTSGNFNSRNVPDNIQWWLEEIGNQITGLSRRSSKAKAAPLHEDIDTLVTALWDQGENTYDPKAPYNAFCPEVDGRLSITGCSATALAQVLYYHKWPQEPLAGPLPGYSTQDLELDELPAIAFDWQNMVDDYTKETTPAQQEAVATLMRYCGQSIQMVYSPDGSNACYYDLDMLVKLFGYDQGAYTACANNYTVSGWDNLLYNELKEGRPLVYGGYNSGGGHSFVIDGYQVKDGAGYFHVNWGWGGLDNGYFKIAFLDSDAQGSGASSTSDGYNRHQEAVIGLQPARGPLVNYGRYLFGEKWNENYNGQSNSFVFVNTSYLPGSFVLCWAEQGADGELNFHDYAYADTLDMPGFDNKNMYAWGYGQLHPVFRGLTPGRHEMILMNKEAGTDATWEYLYGPNNYIEVLIGEDGQQEDLVIHPSPQLSASASKIKIDGIKQWGLRQDVTVTLTNGSQDDFIGAMGCLVYKMDGSTLKGLQQIVRTGIMVEGNSTADVIFPISVMSSGRYILVLTKMDEMQELDGVKYSDVKNMPGYIGYRIFTIDNLQFYCSDMAYNVITDKEGNACALVAFQLVNATGMTYDSKIVSVIYKKNADGDYDEYEFSTGSNPYVWMKLENNMWCKDYIELPEPLEPGEYVVQLCMANDFKSLQNRDFFPFAECYTTVEDKTGMESLTPALSDDEGDVYDLSGRKIANGQQPTAKGVYIKNGRKVLIGN
jgi:hypothetical protein